VVFSLHQFERNDLFEREYAKNYCLTFNFENSIS